MNITFQWKYFVSQNWSVFLVRSRIIQHEELRSLIIQAHKSYGVARIVKLTRLQWTECVPELERQWMATTLRWENLLENVNLENHGGDEFQENIICRWVEIKSKILY
jgi:hypothetical protein